MTLSNSLESIGSDVFRYCTSLESITIPDSVTSISVCTFEYCSSLTSVIIPESVTSIDIGAFDGCSSLTSVTIPKSVTYMGLCAFYACPNLDVVYYSGTEEEWENLINSKVDQYFSTESTNTNFHPTVICTGVPDSSDTTDTSDTDTFDNQGQNIYDDTPVVAIPAKWDDPDLGDIDGDGSVTPVDAHKALVAYASEQVGQDTGLTEDQMSLADVDDDGSVTPTDAHYMLVYYATQQVQEFVAWDIIILQ